MLYENQQTNKCRGNQQIPFNARVVGRHNAKPTYWKPHTMTIVMKETLEKELKRFWSGPTTLNYGTSLIIMENIISKGYQSSWATPLRDGVVVSKSGGQVRSLSGL